MTLNLQKIHPFASSEANFQQRPSFVSSMLKFDQGLLEYEIDTWI